MNIFKDLPSPDEMKNLAENAQVTTMKVNGHFHTPYSFSAFDCTEKVLQMAVDENIDVLGINDFYTMAGYEEFASLCSSYKKFPLFNIEFMGLLKEEQEKGIKVNDPANPGRTYLSGKGLDYPVSLKGNSLQRLEGVRRESDLQVREMVQKTSDYLVSIDPDLAIDFDEILDQYTRGMVRERHIAQVIRIRVFEKYNNDADRLAILTSIYGGRECKANIQDTASVDGEIRSMLLKSGGPGFVKEDPKAFLDIPDVIKIIRDAGGIPWYPVMLDDSKGYVTEFERDYEALYNRLTSLNIWSLELIPGRNTLSFLISFTRFFKERGFVITFGTEHNTPVLDPLTVSAGDGELDEELLSVNFEGAAVIAAHQFLRAHGEQGFIGADGKPGDIREYVRLGKTIIQQFTGK